MEDLGKIGIREGMVLAAMTLIPNVYLTNPSLSIDGAGNAAWLMKLGGAVLMLLMLLKALDYYEEYVQRQDGRLISYYHYLQQLLGRRSAQAAFAVWLLVFEVQTALLLREFADHILVTALPNSRFPLIILLLGISAVFMVKAGLEVILRAAYIFFLLSVLAVVGILLGLYDIYDFHYLLPLSGFGWERTAQTTLRDLGTWTLGGAIFIVLPTLQNLATARRALWQGMFYSALLHAAVAAGAAAVYDTAAAEKTMLFYEMVRSIHFSQYVQRLDAILIVAWMTAGIIAVLIMQYLSVLLFSQCFSVRDTKTVLPLFVLLTTALAVLPGSIIEVIRINAVFMYYVETPLLLLSFAVLTLAHFKVKRRKRYAAAQ